MLKDSWGYRPAPFNPAYRPDAQEKWNLAIQMATEQEESEKDEWTRETRATVRREIYDELIKG